MFQTSFRGGSFFSVRSFAKAARKAKPVEVPAPKSVVKVRGSPVTIVDSIESATRVARILQALPREAVVAWNIECTDVDMKRFHTAGTGGRVLCASLTAKDVDFGGGSQSVFVDAIPLTDESDDESETSDNSPILEVFKSYFQDAFRLKCSHSVADDYHVLLRHGITLRGVESDTRYLARLANTALSSWEGSAGSSDGEASTSDVQVEKGYDLRASARSFEVSLTPEFADKKMDRFLKRLNGTKIAHFSCNMRPYWIGKTVENAILTLDLHDALKERLQETPWKSQVVIQRPDLSMWDLASLVHQPLLEILAEVEHTGIVVDRDFLLSIEEKTRCIVSNHTSIFRRVCASMKDPVDPSSYLNCDADLINPQSPQQIRQLLFGYPSLKSSEWFSYGKKTDGKKLSRTDQFQLNGGSISISGIGLRPIKSKMNKKRLSDFSAKGLPSVNQKLLMEYAGKDPDNGVLGKAASEDQLGKFGSLYAREACRMLFHLASMSKYEYVLSSFIDPLLEKLVQHSQQLWKIHPSLSLDTSTGRLACRKPNLHNPPNASDTLGLRAAFCAAPGNVLVVADYSQLELRILGHVTNCESMIRSLNAGGDYHSWTAVDMFAHVRQAIEEGRCSVVSNGSVSTVKHMFAAERSKAKAVNFSIAYGKCARSIAEDLDCTLAEAEDLLANWYASKPEVAAWKADTVFKARVSKKVESILGRTRDIPHIDSKLWKGRSERAAVNHCIQGSAADIAICAMIQIGTNETLKSIGFKLLMQIHDEFIIEGPEAHAEEAKKILVELMQNPFRTLNPGYIFKVPLEVDAGIGKNWLEAKP
jgi:DNA polymerase-1